MEGRQTLPLLARAVAERGWAAGQGARIEDRDARCHRITLVQADPDQLFQAWIVLLIPAQASGPPHPKRIQVSAARRAGGYRAYGQAQADGQPTVQAGVDSGDDPPTTMHPDAPWSGQVEHFTNPPHRHRKSHAYSG